MVSICVVEHVLPLNRRAIIAIARVEFYIPVSIETAFMIMVFRV